MSARRCLLPLLLSAAGTALAVPTAAQTHSFTLDADFDSGVLNNVVHNPSNQLRLGPTPVSKTTLVWVDNYVPGWIVRIDSTTGKQTARFDSALQFINGQATGARPSKENCNWANTGNCPGRVAVDTNGDVWIVNRAFGSQGTLSKFSGNIGHCIDRNNNGVIDTSRDLNNDGIVSPTAPEYLGPNDECILTTIPVGGVGHCPRSVAVDKKGKIWVGSCCGGYQIFRFNPNEPVALEATIQMPAGTCMYSAASGGDYVYFSNSGGANGTIRVNIDTLQVQYAPCGTSSYGVVADPSGGWAWLGGYPNNYVMKADFTTNPPSCPHIATPTMITAMTLDLQGNVWASGYGNGTVIKLSPSGTILGTYATGASSPHGLSVDFQGNIWSVQDGYPNLVKFAPNGQNLGSFNIGSPTAGYDYTPYLYSDFTGVQIDRIAPFTRVGIWEGTYDGGANGIPWSNVSWNTEPQGAAPAETSLSVSARAADSLAALAIAPYSACQNGAPLLDVKGRYVQTKVDFGGPGYVTPVLSDLAVQGPCTTVGEMCCVKDPDCNDLKPCTQDLCPVPGGVCEHKLIADCCQFDPDCNDSNACTIDTCVAGTCQHSMQPGCCMSNADCDDGEPCTADLCSGLGGSCSNVQINGCCMDDLDCTKGNICSASTCPSPGGLCDIKYIPGCCKTDADCADTDLCTTDLCDLSNNTCSNTSIEGCCNKDTECHDTDDCTQDICAVAPGQNGGGTCEFQVKPNCCTPTSPEVGKPCDEPVSPKDHPPCKAGQWQCNTISKQLECIGAILPGDEVCDWEDNNCDGNIDENTCPQGTTCMNGVCAKPCGSGEFPCEPGYACRDGVCLPVDCAKIKCPSGYQCVVGQCLEGDGGMAGAAGSGGAAPDGGAEASGGGAGTDGGSSTLDGSAETGGSAAAPSSTGAQRYGQTTGGGGCTCEAGARSRGAWQLWAAAAFAAMIAARRKQRRG